MFERITKSLMRKDKGSDSESEVGMRVRQIEEFGSNSKPSSPDREAGKGLQMTDMNGHLRTRDIEENDVNEKKKPIVEVYTSMSPYISCAMYTFFSVSMVLSNKAISTTLDPVVRARMPQMSVILYQNISKLLFLNLLWTYKMEEVTH